MILKHIDIISNTLSIDRGKIIGTIQLLDQGATIPFISRYRKEATGGLDELQIARIQIEQKRLQELENRRESILNSIEKQGKLTDELKIKIESTYDSNELEDLYLPYKQKRKTRASVAKENGLEPLSLLIFKQQENNISEKAKQFLNEKVTTVEDALQGARDILAENVNEDFRVRSIVRIQFEKDAIISSKVVKSKIKEAEKYTDYFEFSEPLAKCPSHRLLAILRGENEDFLKVSIFIDPEKVLNTIFKLFIKAKNECANQFSIAIEDSYKRLIHPSIETEFKNSSKIKADEEAIKVFAENTKQLLMAAPLGEKRVLALDPGFKSGCKVVCLDAQGNLLHNVTIYPFSGNKEMIEAVNKVETMVKAYKIDAIAIGNGTAGRETEHFIKRIRFDRDIKVFIVNESGASIYSASDIARQEFPQFDVTVRGAVSIGRRLQDPLAELVKIDPKSIGVGQYQHDVDQKLLKESLDRVVESCVNSVGVEINTASKHLLTYVSGLGAQLAQNIVEFRKENGPFVSRNQFKKIPRMGEKTFELCAGFLRIRNAENPLDNSAVHPETYEIVFKMAKDLNCSVVDLVKDENLRKKIEIKNYISENVGIPTLTDIMQELSKPGRDPRTGVKIFEFDNNIRTINDLKEGQILPGIVTNITNFGAFVDIGIKENGLVHISQISNTFIKNPADVLKLNQHVKVKIVSIDMERKRIQLTMKFSE